MIDTIVRFRAPEPPHEALLTIQPAAAKAGFKIRDVQSASFMLPRSDPNIAQFRQLMTPNRPAMVTIERSDGALPWVGFVREYQASTGDAYVTFILNDHAWRMKAARCRKSGAFATASGQLIASAFQEAESRAEPAMYLRIAQVANGPGAAWEFKADGFFDFMQAMAKQTDWEWGFAYDVDEKHVETFLTWDNRQGTDQREQEIWEEGKHLTSVGYSINYDAAVDATLVVGGSGAFAARPAAAINRSGRSSDGVSARMRVAPRPPSLGGTRIAIEPQVTDPAVLFAQAEQMHNAPERIAEQLSFKIVESQVDMSRLALGDLRTVRLSTTDLGTPLERGVRIMALQLNPDTGVHDVETQVVPDAA